MQWCKGTIASAVNECMENIVFIPYAAVGFSYEEYTQKVNNALEEVGVKVTNLADYENEKEAIKNATAIFVGGGNTFHLLKSLQDKDLIKGIQEKVANGTTYVGWSAGSNIASPTICTTNDMPIVQPQSFNALNLIADQINPHYTELTIANHGGESRKKRLEEYLAVNLEARVICLPESSYLLLDKGVMNYFGEANAKLLQSTVERTLVSGTSI